MLEVAAAGSFEAGDEILDRHRLAVVTLEIEVHALLEEIAPEDGRDHPRHLGSLFVDRRRVEIVDLAVLRRPYRVGEGTGIFRELLGFQMPHFGDALHGARAHIGGKLVVAVDGQAFLQAELEPVAAGSAVAGPVVEIFVRDDRLDVGIVRIGRRFGIGEHIFVVENVEALVLHGAHVEIGDRNDHEYVEVVFTAEDVLVPFHRPFQRVHGIGRPRLLAVLDIDLEGDVAAGNGGEGVLYDAEIAGNECKEIARFRMRIEPGGEMASVAHVGATEIVAVRKQKRRRSLVRDDVDGIDRQHVWTIREIGNATEAFGFALGAIDVARAVKAHQLGVGLRRQYRRDGDLERSPFGQFADDERVVGRFIERARYRFLVEQQAGHDELVAIEDERCRGTDAFAAVEDHARLDLRFLRVEFERQVHPFENEIGRPVVFQMNDLASVCPHGPSCSRLYRFRFVEGALDGEKPRSEISYEYDAGDGSEKRRFSRLLLTGDLSERH